MDIRSERELRIELEKEFGSGSRLLADALCSKEIYELNDGIRNKIAYLMEICQDFSIDDPGIIYAVSSLSMDEIEELYEKYAKLLESTKIKPGTLALPVQLFDNYREHFCKLGLNANQILQALRSILELGAAAKTLNDFTKASEAVAEIGMTKEDYCQFISDNAGFIYSDYSRKIQETIDAVVQKFGRDEAIQQIKEHPDWIRLGFS